jgi:hypothetical protein
MKLLPYLAAITLIAALFGCNSNTKKQPASIDSLTNHLKPGKHCYLATFEKDTATLVLDITATGKIAGLLNIKYNNPDSVTVARQSTSGNIMMAEFKGDTLRADYSFISGPKGATKYNNPIALLHKGDSLIMGYGRVYEYLGRNYFDPATPIGFTKSKFRFAPAQCKQ